MGRRIYKDDNWEIVITSQTEYNPTLLIISLRDNNIVNSLELSRQAMADKDVMCEVKDILYK